MATILVGTLFENVYIRMTTENASIVFKFANKRKFVSEILMQVMRKKNCRYVSQGLTDSELKLIL